MTLGGRKRHLNVVIDAMLSDAYPSEAMQLGQWLMETGHAIVLTEVNTKPTPDIESTDVSHFFIREIPPDQLN